MAENHVIVAGYAAGGYTKTRPAFQYDYGQELQLQGFPEGMLPASFEMHFSIGMGQAITRIGTDGAVAVPNACLERFGTLTAWLFLHDAETDGETKYVIEIPVRSRAKTTDQEPTPAEQSVITEAIAALNAGVTAAEAAQAAAEAAAESVGEAAEQAQGKAGEAAASATAAAGSASAAGEAAAAAAGSATAAAGSASAAAGSETAAETAAGTAATQATRAVNAANRAYESAGSAAESEDAAGVSAGMASRMADAAAAAAGHASDSMLAARESATAAAGSASAAAGSATTAGAAATAAAGSATAAAGSASDAAGSATTAGTKAGEAAASAAAAAATAAGIAAAGAAQIAAIEAKGEEVIEEIPADYTELSEDVDDLKSALNDKYEKPSSGIPSSDLAEGIVTETTTVTGTTPTITAVANHRYICGECATLDITVPATGIVDVVFESGSTATVLTVTPPTGMTMKWANGFDPSSLDANTVYEINIMDGCYGVVGSWT